MGGRGIELSLVGFLVALFAYGALAARAVTTGYFGRGANKAQLAFATAVFASVAWAALGAYDQTTRAGWPAVASNAADLARYAAWFIFLLGLLEPLRVGGGGREIGLLRPVGLALSLFALGALGASASGLIAADWAEQALLFASMSLPVFGLVLVEQLFRNLPEDGRWSVKPLCLGLAVGFAFDLYIYSQAVLFGEYDPDAFAVRGIVHGLAVPLLFAGARRQADWKARIQVSHGAAFFSASLLLAGAYLLFVAAVGYYVRFFGGTWGRALQLALLFSALVFLGALVLSGSLRAKLRVFVGKHFFAYRYDYREEWLRFTTMLAAASEPQDVRQAVVRGLADMVQSQGGGLWTLDAEQRAFVQVAHINAPALDQQQAVDSAFSAFMQAHGWIVDIAEARQHPERYEGLDLPGWLHDVDSAWAAVPLLAGERLTGFVLLAAPRTAMELDWEVRDLLKTAGRQAAVHLAQMQATEALLEARKFDAFNRMSAFVVHDLKNIVTQLSLMLKNAKRLHDNPEFQQDMLMTVESSLEKMRQLMLQLREGERPPGGPSGVELLPIVERVASVAAQRGRELELKQVDRIATRGHAERIERVIGHVVQNAFDATPPEGHVWLKLSRRVGQACVEVGDTGQGMTREFVETRLFKPFSTTKEAGMGIGSYESFQYVRELGGRIEVDSEPGRGTIVTLLLPVLETRRDSDLQSAGTT